MIHRRLALLHRRIDFRRCHPHLQVTCISLTGLFFIYISVSCLGGGHYLLLSCLKAHFSHPIEPVFSPDIHYSIDPSPISLIWSLLDWLLFWRNLELKGLGIDCLPIQCNKSWAFLNPHASIVYCECLNSLVVSIYTCTSCPLVFLNLRYCVSAFNSGIPLGSNNLSWYIYTNKFCYSFNHTTSCASKYLQFCIESLFLGLFWCRCFLGFVVGIVYIGHIWLAFVKSIDIVII